MPTGTSGEQPDAGRSSAPKTTSTPKVPPQAASRDEGATAERVRTHDEAARRGGRETDRGAGAERGMARPTSLWMAAAVLGAVSIVLGIIVLAWPSASLGAIAVLLAIQAFVFGAFALACAAVAGGSERMRLVAALFGVFAFIIGILMLRNGMLSLPTLALLVGLFWFVAGALTALAALVGGDGRHRMLALVAGCLGVVVGIVVLAMTGISLAVLAAITGIWLIVFGALTAAAAFMGRRGKKRSRHAETAAA
jgi:uncharacterized membrane protein HdeD (DUF308 family)